LRAVVRELAGVRCEFHELRELLKHFRPKKPKGRLDLSFGLVRTKNTKGNDMPTTLELTNEQEIDLTIAPKTAKGKLAKVDGVPSWTLQSGSSVTITPSADGKTATARTVDDGEGESVILAEADADLGAGFEPLDETITIRVSVPKAASLGITVGDPRLKSDEEPAPAEGDAPAAVVGKPRTKAKKR